MIYVLEIDGVPAAKSPRAYAYLTRDSAERAAKSIRGARVVAYGPRLDDGPLLSSIEVDDVVREAQAMQRQRDELARLVDAAITDMARMRATYGAHPEETDRQWIARLYSGWCRWRDLLAEARRIEGDEADR